VAAGIDIEVDDRVAADPAATDPALSIARTGLDDVTAGTPAGAQGRSRSALLTALSLLDENERLPSRRGAKLEGDQEGSESASASIVLLTCERMEGGRKQMLSCSKHHDQ